MTSVAIARVMGIPYTADLWQFLRGFPYAVREVAAIAGATPLPVY